MKYAVVPMANEMKRSSTRKFSNDTQSPRTIVFVEKLHCSICLKILTGFANKWKALNFSQINYHCFFLVYIKNYPWGAFLSEFYLILVFFLF